MENAGLENAEPKLQGENGTLENESEGQQLQGSKMRDLSRILLKTQCFTVNFSLVIHYLFVLWFLPSIFFLLFFLA